MASRQMMHCPSFTIATMPCFSILPSFVGHGTTIYLHGVPLQSEDRFGAMSSRDVTSDLGTMLKAVNDR
jgi:hypothetical protein